jgi:hypothetical protein
LKERKPKSAYEMIDLDDPYQSTYRGSVIMNKSHTQITQRTVEVSLRNRNLFQAIHKENLVTGQVILYPKKFCFANQQIRIQMLKRVREENINLVNHKRKDV